jgi:hypothetical protein
MVGYIIFKETFTNHNETIMIFDTEMPKHLLIESMKKKIKCHGLVDVNKWVCYDNTTKEMDHDASQLLRQTFSV